MGGRGDERSDPYERREQLFPTLASALARVMPTGGSVIRAHTKVRGSGAVTAITYVHSLAMDQRASLKILRIQEHSSPLSTDVRDLK